MKTIPIIHKFPKEEFPKDFRLRIFYSVMIDCVIEMSDDVKAILEQNGFSCQSDNFWTDSNKSTCFLCNDNKFAICFEHNFGFSNDRLAVVTKIFNDLAEKLNYKITALLLVHQNRYVLSNFTDTDDEKEKALRFFFTKEFATDEELIYKEDDVISYSNVIFSEAENDATNLDFTIAVMMLAKSSQQIGSGMAFNILEDMAYRYWREATSNAVIKEMRRKDNE